MGAARAPRGVAEPGEHRAARRVGGVVLTVLLAGAGTIGLLAFFVSRDDAPVSSESPAAVGRAYPSQGARHLRPGERPNVRYNSAPPTSGPHVPVPVRRDRTVLSNDQLLHALHQGNVVVAYGTAQPPPALVALADDEAGPYDRTLADAGQAVILARRPGTAGVVGLAWRHLERFPSASDPALREFVRHWLDH